MARWSRLQQCLALRIKVRRQDIGSRCRDLWSPVVEKTPDRGFRRRIALGRRIGNPKIDLKAAVSLRPHVGRPFVDSIWLLHKCAAASKSAGIGDGDSE